MGLYLDRDEIPKGQWSNLLRIDFRLFMYSFFCFFLNILQIVLAPADSEFLFPKSPWAT